MSLWDLLKGRDINSGLEEYRARDNAVLIDVRSQEEYSQGRIPQSINVPVQNMGIIRKKVKEKDTPIYTYCLSGARSGQAVSYLKSMGYSDVNNIGGINRYKGEIER
ncbi:MAG: rhodanese-like domain-containing protein [Clostridiales bacterium]|nr:rhodanese-like domain-containing protein [Clostridiales bacterium]